LDRPSIGFSKRMAEAFRRFGQFGIRRIGQDVKWPSFADQEGLPGQEDRTSPVKVPPIVRLIG